MSSLMKKLLNGFSNTNSTESSGEKEVKVYNIKTNVPEIDQENERLFQATEFLQKCGNHPGLLVSDFYAAVLGEDPDITDDELDNLLTAAIAIETMMSMDSALYENNEAGISEPTIH